MARHGHVPLPPYITHADDADDESRYQTVFDALDARGVQRASVTLHVGAGTFAPMKTERISEHVMHHERYAIPPETLRCHRRLPGARRPGGGGRHDHGAHTGELGAQRQDPG